MMEILKKNLFWIICGVVAVLGIALGFLGLNAMASVKTEMEQAGELERGLQSAKGRPVNKAAIDAEHDRVTKIREDFEQVVNLAHRSVGRAPLGVKKEAWEAYLAQLIAKKEAQEGEPKPPSIPDCVFPEAVGPKAIAFQEAYRAELDRLRGLLNGGTVPTASEIQYTMQLIKDEQPDAKKPAPPPPGPAGEGAPAPETAGAKAAGSGLIPKDECYSNPACRASVEKAHRYYCYLADDALEVVRGVLVGELKDLQPELLWDAQRTLWVQQDVVEVLAAINDAAAAEIKKTGAEPWVGLLPIKDVISIRVSDYLQEKSEGTAPAKPGGETAAKPPGTSGESFTGLVSDPLHDTVQFTVKLVVDARRITAIVGELTKSRFHTPIRIAYAAEPPNLKMSGKIYGEDPVVNLVVDFETHYFTDVYRPLMPKAILADLGAAPAEGGGG